MTTKAPVSVKQAPAETLEHLAYSIVADIPTREPNDRNRLGFCLWSWLQDRKGTLDQAVRNAGVRSDMPVEEMIGTIRKRLEERDLLLSGARR